MRQLMFILPALVFMGIAGGFLVGLYTTDSSLDSALIGKPVPAFDLPPVVDDRPGLASTDLGGEITLINFYASWCAPCRAEHPLLTDLARIDGVTIHGIAWKDKQSDSREWLAELGNPYTRLGLDLENDVGIDFGLYGVPETYVIDAGGRILLRHAGPVTAQVLEWDIKPMLEAGAFMAPIHPQDAAATQSPASN